MKAFFKQYQQELAILTGLALFLFFWIANPCSLEDKAKLVLAVAILMITWWCLKLCPYLQ